jgi:hypothetical protein
MAKTRTPCLLDSSVLINFLAVDRVDLLATHPDHHFLITPHVRDEVTEHYPDQVQRLLNALASGALEGTRVEGMAELVLFAQIEADGFGPGESAAIAAAIHRDLPVAILDGAARKRAIRLAPGLRFVTTEDIMVAHIRATTITLESADAIKAEWETSHRFRIKAKSFQVLL